MRGRTATICTQAGLQTNPGKDLRMGSKGGKCRDMKKKWKQLETLSSNSKVWELSTSLIGFLIKPLTPLNSPLAAGNSVQEYPRDNTCYFISHCQVTRFEKYLQVNFPRIKPVSSTAGAEVTIVPAQRELPLWHQVEGLKQS